MSRGRWESRLLPAEAARLEDSRRSVTWAAEEEADARAALDRAGTLASPRRADEAAYWTRELERRQSWGRQHRARLASTSTYYAHKYGGGQ